MTYILGNSLSDPMVDDDRPTVTMHAYSDPSLLPWQVVSYRLMFGEGDGFAFAHATLVSDPPPVEPQVWRAFCAGPGDTTMEETDFPTAEAARAAVEEHIAKQIEETP